MAVKFRAFTNSSSFVGNIRYDQDEQSMTGILSGKHYQWCGVPESKFDSFQGAGSAGAFFNRDIKGQYDCSSMGKLNEVQSRLSQLQKLAVDYKTNWKTHGADMDAIRAFKSKEVYSSGKNHYTGSKYKYRTDGKSLFLHDYEIARHHKDGIEISNAGYDSNLTYKTHQALGINSKGHAKHPKGLITLGSKEIDKNSGEWVLVNHGDISADPIIPDAMRKNQKAKADGTFVKKKKPKRETAEQAAFRERATQKELKEQGKEGGKPLSKVNIQKTDQRIINELTKIQTPLPTDKLGQDAHHLLEYSGDGDVGKKLGLNKTKDSVEDNSIMIPKDYHKLLSNFKNSSPQQNMKNLRQMDSKIRQLKGKLQKIATDINRSPVDNNMSKSDEIINSFKNSGLSIEGVDGVYDTENHKILDANNSDDVERLRGLYGKDKYIGTNSETDTRDGPNTNDLERTRKELQDIEDKGGVPALGFDSTEGGSLEALNVSVVNSKEEILQALNKNQWGTGILHPNGKFEIVKSLKYIGRNK